jgi:hypothetical protein
VEAILLKPFDVTRVLLISAMFVLWATMTTFAPGQSSSSPKDSVPPKGKPITVVGCLTGYEGRYTLGTSSDALYLLDGDGALFKRYNARMVRLTGTVSEPPAHTSNDNVLSQQPPTLTVSQLKKVADGCN